MPRTRGASSVRIRLPAAGADLFASLAKRTDEIDEGAQGGGKVATAGIVEKRPREALPPRFQHGLQGTTVEIGRRRRGGEALLTWANRHGYHVLLEPLFVTDPCIAAGCQHVDEAVFGNHLEADVRIGSEEGWHDTGQDEARGTDRHIQSKRTRRFCVGSRSFGRRTGS